MNLALIIVPQPMPITTGSGEPVSFGEIVFVIAVLSIFCWLLMTIAVWIMKTLDSVPGEDSTLSRNSQKSMEDNPEITAMKEQSLLDLPQQPDSPHHATCMADLMSPFTREAIRTLCKKLKTVPSIEARVMFGDGVDFYRLSGQSARALEAALKKQIAQND